MVMRKQQLETQGLDGDLRLSEKIRFYRRYIALLSSKTEHIKDKTDRLTEEARSVGLRCNTHKCKVMRISKRNNDPVTLNGETLKTWRTLRISVQQCQKRAEE